MKKLMKRSPEPAASNDARASLLKRVRPENVLPRFRREIDEAFGRMWRKLQSGWPAAGDLTWPAVDIGEDEHTFRISVDAPGVNQKDLDVEVSGNLLTIRGSRQSEYNEKRGGWQRQERVAGSFYRMIPLPDYVDSAKIQARYNQGVLSIQIEKIPGQGPKRVAINT